MKNKQSILTDNEKTEQVQGKPWFVEKQCAVYEDALNYKNELIKKDTEGKFTLKVKFSSSANKFKVLSRENVDNKNAKDKN